MVKLTYKKKIKIVVFNIKQLILITLTKVLRAFVSMTLYLMVLDIVPKLGLTTTINMRSIQLKFTHNISVLPSLSSLDSTNDHHVKGK